MGLSHPKIRLSQTPSQADFRTGPISTVNNGLKTLRYLGPEIWNIILPDIKTSGNIEEFERKIKRWTPKSCPCKAIVI